MDAAFNQAANPRTFKVLGLRLKPLTLGHRFILQRHGCAFISGDEAKIEDLVLASFVCSQHWNQAERGLESWWFNSFVWLWSQTFRWMILPLEYKKFHLYFDTSHQCPTPVPNGEFDELNSPYDWRLLVMLTEKFHRSKDDAFSTTLAEANCLWATRGEMEGSLQLFGGRMLALREFAREQDLLKFGARN